MTQIGHVKSTRRLQSPGNKDGVNTRVRGMQVGRQVGRSAGRQVDRTVEDEVDRSMVPFLLF